MNHRATLEKYLKKLEGAERGKSKELRLNRDEIIEFHTALLRVMLDNAELSEKELRVESDLKALKQKHAELMAASNSDYMDGGTFK